jgi:NadR type nicotinamide-nucleotide adenylyltransferase
MLNDKVLKIVITGPESSGKTTLCMALAKYFNTAWVPEYAREYLNNLDNPYVLDDLYNIAQGQIKSVSALQPQADKILFIDTHLIVLKIWSEYKFGSSHPGIEKLVDSHHIDYYLLCKPDIQWEYDPLRENQGDREEIYKLYDHVLRKKELPFTSLDGSLEKRMEKALVVIHQLIQKG